MNREDLKKHEKEVRYTFGDSGVSMEIGKMGSAGWYVVMGGPMRMEHRTMLGRTIGGFKNPVPNRQKAEDLVLEILEDLRTPLTSREIRHYFSERWIRGEEQADELRRFKNHLLNGDFENARMVYNKQFSNFTRECIPLKVHYQCRIN